MSMKVTMAEFVGLEPCPFCSGEAFVRIDVSLHPAQSRYRVGCDKDSSCHGWYGHSRHYTTEAEAIKAWNTRAERTCERVTHGLERDREIATVSWTCSECGAHMGRDYDYCPNCGAKVVNR